MGQVIKWNGTQWSPDIDIGSSGADATSIRGVSISATAATSGQIMQYNGSQWAPVNFVTDPTMGGDVAQTASASKVVKIQEADLGPAVEGIVTVVGLRGGVVPAEELPVGRVGGGALPFPAERWRGKRPPLAHRPGAPIQRHQRGPLIADQK